MGAPLGGHQILVQAGTPRWPPSIPRASMPRARIPAGNPCVTSGPSTAARHTTPRPRGLWSRHSAGRFSDTVRKSVRFTPRGIHGSARDNFAVADPTAAASSVKRPTRVDSGNGRPGLTRAVQPPLPGHGKPPEAKSRPRATAIPAAGRSRRYPRTAWSTGCCSRRICFSRYPWMPAKFSQSVATVRGAKTAFLQRRREARTEMCLVADGRWTLPSAS